MVKKLSSGALFSTGVLWGDSLFVLEPANERIYSLLCRVNCRNFNFAVRPRSCGLVFPSTNTWRPCR